MYMAMKHIHMTAVAISILFFIIRFAWLQFQSPLLQRKWVKITPHIIDTVLLASAIALCVIIQQYPIVNGWVTAKVIGVILYIVAGLWALKWAKQRGIQWIAFLVAISILAATAKVAITKQALFF